MRLPTAFVCSAFEQVSAFLAIVTVLMALGGVSRTLEAGGAIDLQSRATALHARWAEMAVQGVPQSDLSSLAAEWASAESTTFLGVGSAFWVPGGAAAIDRWQAQTDSLWSRNLDSARAGAVAAEEQLHRALGSESAVLRKQWAQALAQASTPAEFQTLRNDWSLQAKLVPVNRRISAIVVIVTDLVARTNALGIVSDPAAEVLADANDYAAAEPQRQIAHAEHLTREVTSLERSLRVRVDAATVAKTEFDAATYQVRLANSYGVAVLSYQARLDTDFRSYSAATSVDQFNAIAADLNQIVTAVKYEISIRAAHVISGVHFYYQIHSLSCEEAATSMALTHQGMYVSQDQILSRLGVDNTPVQLVNGYVVRWGNPDKAFVGNVDGSESNYSGQQANPKALMRVLNSYGARIIDWSEPGVTSNIITAQEIYHQVLADHPVVVYGSWDWRWHPIYYYTSEDGNQVPLISPANDHVYVVIGVTPNSVLVNDSIRGQYWVSKAAFQASYEFGMAIVFA